MVSLEEINEFVNGKRLLLVGNSDPINKSDYSEIIDSWECVVRMNHGIPRANLGKKTDIWICSFNNTSKQAREFPIYNATYVIRLNKNRFINKVLESKLYIWPSDAHKKLKTELGSLPSTGVMAIDFFMNYCKPLSITLIGFDSFATKTFYHRRKVAHMYHDPERERTFIEKLIKRDKIQRIDLEP